MVKVLAERRRGPGRTPAAPQSPHCAVGGFVARHKYLEFHILYNVTGRNLFLTVASFEELNSWGWVGGQKEHLFH